MARLTKVEERLLKFAPKPGTWRCGAAYCIEIDGVEIENTCIALNRHTADECWLCGAAKSETAVDIYPAYLAVCEKAGAEPKYGPQTIEQQEGV